MFLSAYMDECDNETREKMGKWARESCTYNAFYDYWRDNLFERIMRLFVWDNTYSLENGKAIGVKPKEIEQRLILQGQCGITTIPGETELTAMFGNFYGVSKYLDEKPNYMVRCPVYSGSRTIGQDIVVIDNCSLRNPSYELVHHYAILLAHNEVTFIDTMVNARDSGGIPVAGTEKQKQSIKQYLAKVFNGQYDVVTDIGNLGLQYAGSDRRTQQNIVDIWTTREKLLKSFYSDIGVKSAFEKRSNSVVEEVEADTSLLLLNISDMIKCRQDGCEAVNDMYGTNWTVRIADEIEYNTENEAEVEGDV